MDIKKMAQFNQRMGKVQKLSKGGLIKRIGNRQYFAPGGSVNPDTVPLNTVNPSNNLVPGNAITNQNAVNPNKGIAGGIGGALGLNDNFQAGAANIQAGTNAGQLNTAYTGANNAINAQTGLVNTLTPGVAQGAANQATAGNILTNVAQGNGPNPAQAMLNQNTGQNIAQQAALAANVRGAGTNAGLIAANNAATGAGIQQNAIGQEATTQAQQQIAAANAAAGIGSNQVAQGQTAVGGLNTAQQGEQNILQGANTAYNNAGVGMQTNINNVNSATAMANQQENNGILGGIASMASNIPVVGSLFKGLAKGGNVVAGPHKSHVANFLFSKGGPVPAMVSPGERYLSPDEVRRVVEHGEDPRKMGRKILGKPKVKGDSLKNDIVPATLEEGGVVIPRHVEGKNNAEKSELFVRRAVHMKHPKKGA